METLKNNPLWMAGLTALMIGAFAAQPALAADDTASVVQTLTDALTGAATGAVASSTATDQDLDVYGEEEAAADQAAGLPRFNNRQERREHMRKLREENPERFKEIKQKRREHWMQNHPEAAKKFREKKSNGYGHKKGPDYRKNHHDRMEDHRDRMEDKRDHREDRWDAKHDSDRGFPGKKGYGHPGKKFRENQES